MSLRTGLVAVLAVIFVVAIAANTSWLSLTLGALWGWYAFPKVAHGDDVEWVGMPVGWRTKYR